MYFKSMVVRRAVDRETEGEIHTVGISSHWLCTYTRMIAVPVYHNVLISVKTTGLIPLLDACHLVIITIVPVSAVSVMHCKTNL